jgi:predicted RNA-binding Zn-ribbon protein involved in translation (DUF1610 family)
MSKEFNKIELIRLYTETDFSIRKISSIIGIDHHRIKRILISEGIEIIKKVCKKTKILICPVCGEEIITNINNDRKFCSPKCQYEARSLGITKRIVKVPYKNSIPLDRINEYKFYRLLVRKLTKRNKKELLKNWDGIDYYDGKYIKDNFLLHHLNNNYPTIDHKQSIHTCFKNKISAEDCSMLNNLCFTKRIINCIKNNKNNYG